MKIDALRFATVSLLCIGFLTTAIAAEEQDENLLRRRAAKKTPDDSMTPASESECEGYQGAAKGLCVAFCEAKDCDEEEDAAGCDKIKTQFQKITGEQNFPCEFVCPCWDPSDLDQITQENLADDTCKSTLEVPMSSITIEKFTVETTSGEGGTTFGVYETNVYSMVILGCTPPDGTDNIIGLDQEVWDGCLDQLATKCAEVGA